MITYQTEDIATPLIKKRETTEWVKQVAASYGKKVGEIAYIFCSDEKILEVNRQYLEHDYYTDIITFDYTEGNRISGDLFISLDTVRTNAEQFDQPYERELHRVIIHGILHLCGINDPSYSYVEIEGMKRYYGIEITFNAPQVAPVRNFTAHELVNAVKQTSHFSGQDKYVRIGFRATPDQRMENVNEVRRLLRDLYKPQQVIFSQTILKQ